ncbi:MAG TPA: YicC/YloC family endoribonuclease [Caulobacteraceae bacterium]|nr:YicC/YloC family endoribonuclease [Caulobacteraceae bacterium]
MALSGMTGFARREAGAGQWTWAVEARSVNGRNLEVRFRGPPGFDALERIAREAAQARFQRGQVNVSLQARRIEAAGQVRINRDVLDRYLKVSEEYVLAGLASQPRMDGILALRGVIEAGDEDDDAEARAAVEVAMAATIAEALDGLKASRLEEGAALERLLSGLVERIDELSVGAEAEAEAQVLAIRDRAQRRMAELAGEAATPERILQEAAALALKADVREELDRLKTHVVQARALMADDQAAGRRLDFLTQEFMREANTLCSKSATSALTQKGLALKAAIDQFREQTQNVE